MSYVALGDSFAAGLGGGGRLDPCGRTRAAYPFALASARGGALNLQACHGATVPDVRRTQVGALGPGTDLVSLTVGGNDVGFTRVLVACAAPAWMADGLAAVDDALRVLGESLPALLTGLLADIADRAPRARRIVAGYPQLFDGPDCHPLTFFSAAEIAALNSAADRLATTMAAACETAGAEFVDVRTAFDGHGACSPGEWISGVTWPIDESFHPNATGHERYGVALLDRLGLAPGGDEVEVSYGTVPPARPPVFSLPDLASPHSLAGARRWGLDPSEVGALGERVRPVRGVRPDRVDAEAVRRLHELDAQVRARRA